MGLVAENARLRAALEAMLHRHILYCGGESMAFAGHTDVALFQEARAALATPAPDVVQEAARDTDLLLDAYKGLLVLHRLLDKIGLQAGMKTTSDLADRIVAAHPEFQGRAALRAIAGPGQ